MVIFMHEKANEEDLVFTFDKAMNFVALNILIIHKVSNNLMSYEIGMLQDYESVKRFFKHSEHLFHEWFKYPRLYVVKPAHHSEIVMINDLMFNAPNSRDGLLAVHGFMMFRYLKNINKDDSDESIHNKVDRILISSSGCDVHQYIEMLQYIVGDQSSPMTERRIQYLKDKFL